MDPRNRGPVIERANEPGIPRGLMRLFILAALVGGAWWAGYVPDTSRLERTWQDVTVAVNDFWRSATEPVPSKPVAAPTPAPTQTARAPVAPPSSVAPPISRPSPSSQPGLAPPPPTPNFNANQIIADAKRALGETTGGPKPPEAPQANPAPADPFAQAFRRDVLGQLNSPAPPAASAPAPAVPTPPVVASAPPPERTSIFPRAPGLPRPPYTPELLDGYVEQALNTFNASRDVPVKRAAMEKVVAAAQIGHGPARGVIVRGFPASTIIRDVIAPADVVRFSLDFVIHKRAYSNDARKDFMALAAWFDGERKDAAFGEGVFDAVRDDSRLQTPDAINDLMSLLYRAERGCVALRRHINVFDPNTTTTGHCGLDLAGATPQKAKQAGPAGIEARRFREGLELLQKTLGSPT